MENYSSASPVLPLPHSLLALILAALATIGPFSIDTYLPAFHAIADDLGATQVQVQQTLAAYMLPFAFMALWHGALSDALGRRRVLVVAMLLYSVASVTCMLAPSIEWLWIARALQGMTAGAGMVVGRAVIRDLLDGAEAQRLMSQVTMMFALAPAVAPLVGGAILAFGGWRSIFAFLALFGLLLGWVSWKMLPETLPQERRQSLHPVKLGKAYMTVFLRLPFFLLVIAVACNFNGFFIYVLSAPAFLIEHLGRSPQAFGWLFVPGVIGMMAGSMLSGRLAGRWSQPRAIATGFVVMGAAATFNVALNMALPPALPWSVLPIMIYNFGMALAMPSLTILALDLFPARRGLASSCQSFTQMAFNAFTAAITAPLLWASTLGLALGMSAYLLLGFGAFVAWRRTGGVQASGG